MTAAADSPARLATSVRVSGPWHRTVVKIWEAAGVWAGNASPGRIERMAGNLGGFFSAVNKRIKVPLKLPL